MKSAHEEIFTKPCIVPECGNLVKAKHASWLARKTHCSPECFQRHMKPNEQWSREHPHKR